MGVGMTEWNWRIFIFLPLVAVTATNRTAVGTAFSSNGSGESIADEGAALDSAARLSADGSEPASRLAINTVAKDALKDALVSWLSGVSLADYYIVANVTTETDTEGDLITSNRPSVAAQIGSAFTFEDALADLALQRIEA